MAYRFPIDEHVRLTLDPMDDMQEKEKDELLRLVCDP